MVDEVMRNVQLDLTTFMMNSSLPVSDNTFFFVVLFPYDIAFNSCKMLIYLSYDILSSEMGISSIMPNNYLT